MITHYEVFTPLFFLLLSVSGNFTSETFSCQLQRYLTDNMYAKQFLIICLIYFTMSFSEENKRPINKLINSLLVWFVFIIFTKMDLTYSIICFFIFIAVYTINDNIEYINNDINKTKETKDNDTKKYKTARTVLSFVLLLIMCIGFIVYLKRQISEKAAAFYKSKFLFGTINCDNS